MHSTNSETDFTGREDSPLFAQNRRGGFAPHPLATETRGISRTAAFLLPMRDTALTAAVLVPLAWQAARRGVGLAEWGMILLAAFLFLTVRQAPIARTREKSLTFLPSVACAVGLWAGAFSAAGAALLACFLAARFGGARIAGKRRRTRMQGVHLALSILLANGVFTALLHLFRLTAAPAAFWNTPFSPLNTLGLLTAATAGAVVFLGSTLLQTYLGEMGLARSRIHTGEMPVYLKNLALSLAMGLLPVVLLTPLAAHWGLAAAFPLGLLLVFGAQAARLSLEVRDLRGQIETAEALGRASILEPEETDAEKFLERFLSLAQGLVKADRSLVWTLDPETGLLTPTAALPDMGLWKNEEAVFGKGLIGHAAARLVPRLIPDAAKDPHRIRREIAAGAWLLYPVMVHERLIGVVQWVRPVGRPFTSEDIARLDALVPQAAVALENVRIRQAMNHLAATDGLTGLWNHRKMHELLRIEMKRSTRYHRALSVLMMDVDSFKTFNDTYGHPQGDQLLRNIASILRAGVRTVDFAGRYGGEEFLVILPETSKDDACRMAERIRSDIEAQAALSIDGKPVRRTVSVGVASYPEDALSPAEIVQRADEALYRAKHAGKNCVIWA